VPGKRLGVGIVGCGEISVAHNRAYAALPDHVELVALSDVVEATARRRAGEFGVEKVYADYHDLIADKRVDVVAVCTPHYLHAPVAIAAAEAGKHVLVEKPMAMNVGEVHEMVEAARRGGVKMTVSSEVVNPRHRFIKERVLPEIGPIAFSYLVDFYYRDLAYYEKARWRGTWAREGGGLFVNQAIYTWDPSPTSGCSAASTGPTATGPTCCTPTPRSKTSATASSSSATAPTASSSRQASARSPRARAG